MSEKTRIIDTDKVVIRFSGDSGDGMQLAGTIFSNLSAVFGNEISTFPDYPAEIRAPQGTLGGVSGFQVHLGKRIYTPGDKCDVLVAMNPAALKTNVKFVKPNTIIIFDEDSFTESDLKKADYKTLDHNLRLEHIPLSADCSAQPRDMHSGADAVRFTLRRQNSAESRTSWHET